MSNRPEQVAWFTDVACEVSCGAEGCDQHGVFADINRKECRKQMTDAGWRVGKDHARCPNHSQKETDRLRAR